MADNSDYAITLDWGDDVDGDSFVTLFSILKGWILEVNGTDVWLVDVRHDKADNSGIPGLVTRPWRADENQTEPSDEDPVTFVSWVDVKKVVIY